MTFSDGSNGPWTSQFSTSTTSPRCPALGITSRRPQEASPQQVLAINRGHWGIESVPQAHGKEVRHELTDCVKATRKMRVGPSESAFRSGLQTTPSCCGQESWW